MIGRTPAGGWRGIAFAWQFGVVLLGSGCSADVPLGFVPGGRFEGDLERGPEPDWTFAAELDSVDVEIGGPRPRTVRTGIVVDGVPHLPVTWAPLERWPGAVREDPRVILRAVGLLDERHATRIDDAAELDWLRAAGQAKYGAPFHARSLAHVTHYFRLGAPAAAGSALEPQRPGSADRSEGGLERRWRTWVSRAMHPVVTTPCEARAPSRQAVAGPAAGAERLVESAQL